MIGFRLLPVAILLAGQAAAQLNKGSFRVEIKRQSSGTYPALNGQPLKESDCKPEWKAALDAAIKAGKIPDIPPSSSVDGGTPTYPSSVVMKDVCNWSIDQCQGPNDIHSSPDGWAAVNFDDGPTQATMRLNSFLVKNNISATRFLIGGQVAGFPEAFKDILKDPNQQLAVHTYTHHQMTTLTSEQAVAELGWTMQVILDMSGFLPTIWRGPTGDVDNRIRAIAEELFGLRHVSWNYDSNDWCVSQGQSVCPGETPGSTADSVTAYIDKTMDGTKSPGVLMLEHELSDITVGFFEQHTWPGIQKNGWKHGNIGELQGQAWYANAANSASSKTSVASVLKSGSAGAGAASGAAAKGGKGGTGPASNSTSAATADSPGGDSGGSTSSSPSAQGSSGSAGAGSSSTSSTTQAQGAKKSSASLPIMAPKALAFTLLMATAVLAVVR
ncbi:hypothetical protein OC861_004484 [Tilletia horrida]|nr:hypothetical protein OC845_003192 [Tilletia horrida]KAK0564074.1 hypothetical protein OC861_004484 [Tilletia horrida]